MKLLRSNKDTLLSVLEPFLRDPTVNWGRIGRTQQHQSLKPSAAKPSVNETDNLEAEELLLKITLRLDGVYNIVHPRHAEIIRHYKQRKDPAPVRGLGATIEESLPLSVQGQVQRLIEEAVDDTNLVQMYFGWTPWL